MGNPEDARMVLTDVITAGQQDDFARARGSLDTVDWLTAINDPQAPTFTSLPPAEQEHLVKRFFGFVKQVTDYADLPDAASIKSAVGAAAVESHPQLKVVRFTFSAPDRERPGDTVIVSAKMRYGFDRIWRLADVKTEF